MALDVGELVAYLKLDDSQYQRGAAGIRGQLLELKRLLASVPDTRPKVTVSVNEAMAETQMRGIMATVAELDRSDATVEVKVDTDKARKDTSQFKMEILGGLTEAAAGMGSLMTKAGMLGPALMAVGAAASSAAAGGVALLGAIGPAAAAGVAAYAGTLLAVKSSMLLVKFASGDLAKALSGDKKAMKGLPPATRFFAESLKSVKKQLDVVRDTAASHLFTGLGTETQKLAKAYMPLLTTAAAQTGDSLNRLAKDGANMVASGPWRKDFATVAKANAGNIGLFGRAGLQVADAARSIFVAAQPLIRSFAQWTLGAAKAFNTMIQGARASGSLAAFFHTAGQNASLLGHIIGNVAVALFRIFKIGGGGQGQSMLRTLQRITGEFRAWTESSSGIVRITGWFATGRANLAAMGRLIRDVTAGLSDMGSGAALAPLLDQIRTQIVPPLLAFLHNASASGALQALVAAVGQVVTVFSQLSAQDSSLKAFAVTLGFLAKSALWIVQNVPGAKQALGAFFVVAGGAQALKLVGLGGAVRGLAGLMGTLATKVLTATGFIVAETTATEANAAATKSSAIATAAKRAAELIAAGASKALAVAQWALNAAMDANPIGLIVIAIAALVAGFIYAYKHSATFRAIVQGALHAVGAAAKWLWHAITAAVGAIVSAWKHVQSATVNVWHAVVNFVKSIPGRILGFFLHWTIVGIIISHWTQIKTRTIIIAVSLVNWVRGLPGRIINALSSLGSRLGNTARDAFGRLRASASAKVGDLIGFVRSIPGRVLDAIGNLGGILFNAGKSIIQGLIDGVQHMLGKLVGLLHHVTSLIPHHKGPMSKDLALLRPAGQAIMSGLITGLDDGTGALISKLHGISARVAVSAPRVGPTVTVAGAGARGVGAARGGDTYNLYETASPRVLAAEVSRRQAFYGG